MGFGKGQNAPRADLGAFDEPSAMMALGKSLALQVAQSCYPGRIFVRALREFTQEGARKYFGRSWSKSPHVGRIVYP